jgi:hypothetical protein
VRVLRAIGFCIRIRDLHINDHIGPAGPEATDEKISTIFSKVRKSRWTGGLTDSLVVVSSTVRLE